MANREDDIIKGLIEQYNRHLLNGVNIYKKETKNAKHILMDAIIYLVNEIATLSHCAGMIYKRKDYEVYFNTVEELKKMLYEKLEEL